ncbi:MAG: glycosyltransferase family 39 protein [Lentisphaeria bacterium]|nr:glycosyltransferase family 39 protein [Lentisphaeria bacterium]NQZ69996.1 glycosyltransferase family 39 protein [Lentisphaeria bacterium]
MLEHLKRREVYSISILLLLYLYLGLFTLTDYGLTWDAWEYYYGDKNLNYLLSLDSDHLDFQKRSIDLYERGDHPDFYDVCKSYKDNDIQTGPHLIWPLGPTLSSLCKYIFYDKLGIFDPIDAHHLFPLFCTFLLILIVYLYLLKFEGFWPAIIAALIIALYPRYLAHSHNNIKDPALVLFFIASLISCHLAFLNKSWKWMLGCAILIGLALATKANALFIPVILLPWFVTACIKEKSWTQIKEHRAYWSLVIAGPLIAFFVMFICWPLLWQNFPENLSLYIKSLGERGYQGDPHWSIDSIRNAIITMPLAICFAFVLGTAKLLYDAIKKQSSLYYIMWYCCLIIPILRVSVPGAKDFDVIRHWLEFVPALAMIIATGFYKAVLLLKPYLAREEYIDRLVAGAFLMLLLPVFFWNLKNHPNQGVYYNPAIGNLAGAQERGYAQSTDYWGQSYRQAFNWLNENVAKEKPKLFIAVAEHIGFFSRQIWLDQRIELHSMNYFQQEYQASNVPVYIIYITRKDWYHFHAKLMNELVKRPAVHEIEVDGGVILRIHKIK